ncbi:MAG: hypothetical protein IPF55_10645 [Rhodoferax sp.]|nr:hypothetical protein [Rhodoferax sp.]
MVNDLHGKPSWQHQLSVADSSGSWHNACTPHSDGTSTAMLVPGREQGDGTIDHDATAFAITCTSGASAQQDFEAGWGPAGAVCVRHVRVKNNVTLEQLEAHYPALRGRVGVVCTEAFARAQGALVFNRSDPSGAAP